MEVEDTEENQDPLPSTSEQGTSLNINFIKLEPVFQSETVDKPHPVIIKSEPPVKFESVKSEPTYSSDDEVLEEVEPQYVDQTDIKEEFTVVEEESVDLDDDVKEEIEIDAVDGLTDRSDRINTISRVSPSDLCDKMFIKDRGLQSHLVLHHKIDHQVSVTQDRVSLTQTSRNRQNTKAKEKPCPYCKQQFKYIYRLESHIVENHRNQMNNASSQIGTTKIFKCQHCSYQTVRPFVFERHLRVKHPDVSALACVFCNKDFKAKDNQNSHLLDQHKVFGVPDMKTRLKIHTCHTCDYETIRLEDYQRHLLFHEENPGMIKCEQCGYQSSSEHNFRCHFGSVGEIKVYCCVFCRKEFDRRLVYHSHLLKYHRHQVENLEEVIPYKIHKCTECSYETLSLSGWKHHLASHETTK